MAKASDVYNKLKLRFVGKAEVAAKPKTDDKEPEDNEETQNTGQNTHLGPCASLSSTLTPFRLLFVVILILICIFQTPLQ